VQSSTDVNQVANFGKTATYPIQTFLGDSVLVRRTTLQHGGVQLSEFPQIYRTYVVYNFDWRVVVVPILLMVGNSVSGFGITVAQTRLHRGGYTDPSLLPWMMTYISLTLCLNILCTGALTWSFLRARMSDATREGMITYRILSVSNTYAATDVIGPKKALNKIARIVTESGMIYTVHSIILVTVANIHSTAFFPVADSVRALPLSTR
jgi:hypothetical protein